MATAPLPPLGLNLWTVLKESNRIIKDHARHFLALSVLFLLPLSFSVTVFPTLQNLLTQCAAPRNAKVLLSATPNPIVHHDPSPPSGPLIITAQSLVLSLVFTIFTVALYLLAVGSITSSVLHGFYGRPVKLRSAIGSAFGSFLPLFITLIFAQTILLGILLFFFHVFKGIELVRAEQSSPFISGFALPFISAVALFVLFFVLIYSQVNWALVGVVVVVEKSWGLEPLKRSSFLVNGMRKVALSLIMYFAVLAAAMLWAGSAFVEIGSSTSGGWKDWRFVAQIVVSSTVLTLLFLQNIASCAILYMYCKAMCGEIAEEFAGEYVSLPFDDGKVPHVVSVVCA